MSFSHPPYTRYRPLPADFTQFSLWGGIFFIAAIALVMVGTMFFVVNIFETTTYTTDGWDKQPVGALLGSALGLKGVLSIFTPSKLDTKEPVPVS